MVRAACRDGADTSCVLDGSLTCFNKKSSLDGAPPGSPRATWWLRLAYAHLSVGEYIEASSLSQAAVLAAYDGSGCAGMLVGAAVDLPTTQLVMWHVPATLVHESSSSMVVRSYTIPFIKPGCAVVPRPKARESIAPVNGSQMASAVTLPAMTKGDVVYLTFGAECADPWSRND